MMVARYEFRQKDGETARQLERRRRSLADECQFANNLTDIFLKISLFVL